ncbi:hypothetical protein [Paracoccus onubensis]|uniref:hypothetical protein n=1 Tax=Paracoccus onubensis TaxID=1675788 RepID=UPI002FD407C2
MSSEDDSRQTKWIKAMMPRLQIMKAMLKPSGVLAICIDDNELFHLRMMLDEVFGEENRLGQRRQLACPIGFQPLVQYRVGFVRFSIHREYEVAGLHKPSTPRACQ